jgi:hypothetical protein
MITLTLKETYEILSDASAIVIDDGALMYPSLADLEDSDDNEFLYLGWEEEGLEYSVKFREGENQTVKASGSSLFLIDSEGDEVQLSILTPLNIESWKQSS